MPRHRSRDRDRDRRRHKRYSSEDSRDSYYSSSKRGSRKKKSEKKVRKEKKKRSRRSRSDSSHSQSSSISSQKSSSRQDASKKSLSRDASATPSSRKTYNLNMLDDQINSKTLESINENSFQPKSFSSSSIASGKLIIDLKKDTILIPTNESGTEQVDDSIFHPNFLGEESAKLDKWIKKLHSYRQRFYNE